MVVNRLPPAELPAEEALLGSILIRNDIIGDARWVVEPADFYKPDHQHIFAAMIDLWRQGKPLDSITLPEHVPQVQRCAELLMSLMNAPPATSRWAHYADQVVRASTARRLIHVASDAALDAYEQDPWQVAARLEANVAGLGRLMAAVPDDLATADEVADMTDDVMPDWLVEDWLRVGDRMILVAEEGVGKSVLTFQMAACIAQGVNPLCVSHRFAPCTTLVIDLENPKHVMRDRARAMRSALSSQGVAYTPGLCSVWHRPGGIDLRKRSTQRELDAVLNHVQPSLVILSPLYKAFRKRANEDQEEIAAELQAVLDDARVRYQFTLVIEHHAPKGAMQARELVPFGSSLWLRWPEYGVAMAKHREDRNVQGPVKRVQLLRFRGDRVSHPGWPTELLWGDRMPWSARWTEGASPWAR